MRLAFLLGIAALLAGCAMPPPPSPPAQPAPKAEPLPFDVGNGQGSQFGNYGGQFEGTVKGPHGEDCTVFHWDRPFRPGWAIRYTSASCPVAGHSWMTTLPYTHEIIPAAQSHLNDPDNAPAQ